MCQRLVRICGAAMVASVVLLVVAVSAVQAAVCTWTGANSGDWSDAGNWIGGKPNPGNWDQVVFDSNSTGNLATNCDMSSQGNGFDKITTANPVGDVSINTTYVFGIGDGGIDMSAATHDLAINAYIALRNGAPMPMNVASGRTLTLSQDVAGSTQTISKLGDGKLVLGGGSSDAADNNVAWLDAHAGTVELNKASSDGPDVHAIGNIGAIDSGATVKLTGTGNYQVYQGGNIYVTGGTFDLNGRNQYGGGDSMVQVDGLGSKIANSAPGASIFSFDFMALTTDVEVNTVGDLDLNSGIDGSGGITKTGAGTVSLAGNCYYTGNTTVDAGTFTLDSTGALLMEVNNSGVPFSKLLGSGTLNLDGTLDLDLTRVTDTTGTWNLVDVANLTETYGATFAVQSAVFSGGSWSYSDFSNSGGVWTYADGTKTWTFTESTGALGLSTIPEPGTFSLVVVGLVSLLAYAWRRRK